MTVDDRGRDAGTAIRTRIDGVVVPDPAVAVRRARRRRIQSATLVIAVILAIGAVAVPLLRDADRLEVATLGRNERGAAQVDDRYVPATTTADGVTTIPITLPDGRPFTVRSTAGLDLARLGFRATVAAQLHPGGIGEDTQARTLQVLHTTASERYPGLTPVATYPDAAGRPVPYYVDPAAPERGGLAVTIGSWLILVPDLDDPANRPNEHLTPDQLALWAQNVGGWIDDDGFVVVASTGRALTLDQSAKTAFVLGPTSAHSGSVTVGERWQCEGPDTDTTKPRRFPRTPSGANQGAAWCDRATGLHVTVVGPSRFVDRAIDSFRLAPFSRAPRATKIVLSTNTLTAGSSVSGVVVVVNNTGAPLTYGGCGGLFQVALTQNGAPPSVPWLACLMQITVPEGESVQPVTVLAAAAACSSQPICPLPAGRYDAVLAQDGSDFPPAPSIPVRVVAPRS
jgi:hypothetical protein